MKGKNYDDHYALFSILSYSIASLVETTYSVLYSRVCVCFFMLLHAIN
jgi:hypothetical protein